MSSLGVIGRDVANRDELLIAIRGFPTGSGRGDRRQWLFGVRLYGGTWAMGGRGEGNGVHHPRVASYVWHCCAFPYLDGWWRQKCGSIGVISKFLSCL